MRMVVKYIKQMEIGFMLNMRMAKDINVYFIKKKMQILYMLNIVIQEKNNIIIIKKKKKIVQIQLQIYIDAHI